MTPTGVATSHPERGNEKSPMVRLLLKTFEDISIGFFDIETSFREKVANPG